MRNSNRLSEYFAEIAEIAKTSVTKAIRLQHKHLQPFLKHGETFSHGPQISENEGLDACYFDNSGSVFDAGDFHSTCLDGQFFDQDWNPLNEPDSDEDIDFDLPD